MIDRDVTLPSFLFVGTAKAGTTSIAKYLIKHPQIAIPRKETFFFIRDIYRHNDLPYPAQRSRDEYILKQDIYESLYARLEGKVTGEIGTGYLYHHDIAIPRIKETLGDEVKILMVLRNPMDRCYSSYMHFAKDLHEKGSFEEALEKERQRANEDWDFMWQHRPLGLYAKQVRAYLEAFNHVKVLLYDDLKKDPKAFMKEVFGFIGVDDSIELDFTKSYNPSGEPKNKALQRFITQENFLKRLLRPIFRLFFSKEKREKIRKEAKGKNLKRSEGLSEGQRKLLSDYYKEDISELSQILERPLLEIWK